MARRLLRRTRNLLRQGVAIGAGLILTVGLFFGAGFWRRSEDAKWCRQAAAGVVAGDEPLTLDLPQQVRSACTIQRERQRVFFGAVWRTGGRETAECGFEVARLQLVADQDRNAYEATLKRYGVDDPAFELSNREDQERLVQACLASRQHEPG